MTNYKLKILRNGEPVANYDVAINILDTFEGHYIGQPIAILYLDEDQNRRVILAMGKRDCETEQIEGRNYGPEFYDIINDDLNEQTFKYISVYPLDTPIKSSVGGIDEGITLYDLLHETNGDISRIFDLMFFGEATIHPVVRDPSIVTFNYHGEEEITVNEAPREEDFTYELDRGFVSYGKDSNEQIVENVPYAGTAQSHIIILDMNENELYEEPTVGDYIYRLITEFDPGDITPLNNDGSVYRAPYPGGVYYKDVIVHIVQGVYVGIIDIDTINSRYNYTLQENVDYALENDLLDSFPSSGKYILNGNNKWGLIMILSPQSASCKFNGDTERIQTFTKIIDECTIGGLNYNVYVNVKAKSDYDSKNELFDDLTYYSNNPSYFYEITETDE